MAEQKVKTYYRPPANSSSNVKEASEEGDIQERHAERVALNRSIRDRPKRSITDSALDLVSDENIVATGRHIAGKIPGAVKTGIHNVGNRVLEIGRKPISPPSLPTSSSKKQKKASASSYPTLPPALSLSPAWTRGAAIPNEFLRVPYTNSGRPAKEPKHKKSKNRSQPASVRPEWIRF